MAYYTVCPKCGCNLDPGEKCDCEEEERRRMDFYTRHVRTNQETGQLSFQLDGKDVSYAAKTVG